MNKYIPRSEHCCKHPSLSAHREMENEDLNCNDCHVCSFQGLCAKRPTFPPVQTTAAVPRAGALLLLGHQKNYTRLLCHQLGVHFYFYVFLSNKSSWCVIVSLTVIKLVRLCLYSLFSWAVCFLATAFLKLPRPCGTSTSSRLTPFWSSSLCSSSSSTPSRQPASESSRDMMAWRKLKRKFDLSLLDLPPERASLDKKETAKRISSVSLTCCHFFFAGFKHLNKTFFLSHRNAGSISFSLGSGGHWRFVFSGPVLSEQDPFVTQKGIALCVLYRWNSAAQNQEPKKTFSVPLLDEPESVWKQPGGSERGGHWPESGAVSPCVCPWDPAGQPAAAGQWYSGYSQWIIQRRN